LLGDFGFQVCVLAQHADADVSELATLLGRTPTHASRSGMPVTTPAGARPGGLYPDSRCLVEMASNEDGTLVECLGMTVSALEPLRDYIQQLKNSGGEVVVFARWYPNGDTGEALPAELLTRLGALGVELGFNVYGVRPG